MSGWPLFVELFLVHAIILGWAYWEYRKTSRLLDETREKEQAARGDGAASGTEASP